jgi:two-component system, chemotaxis family, protein-glutamate methylesterase/glutaminase
MSIRVLLVEDSPIVLTILKRMLSTSPDLEIVGTAATGKKALELIPKVQPRVICTDLQMPGMDGLEFIRQVMRSYPCPILVLSAAIGHENTQQIFNVLQAGAIDVLPKPMSGFTHDSEALKQELITKIKVLSGVKVFTLRQRIKPNHIPDREQDLSKATTIISPSSSRRFQVVGIGASTGGPQALQKILTQLPSNFPVPIICVQHISTGFLSGLVNWLSAECKLPIKIAQSGEYPLPGIVYFAPENHQLRLYKSGKFTISNQPDFSGYQPSVTVTFQSIAQFYGSSAIGILLTGMGKDGGVGMQAIKQSGGLTLAQNEASSIIFGMPKEAIRLGAVDRVLSIDSISTVLQHQICQS